MVQVKTCTKCKVEQPVEQFSRDKSTKDGHCYECKTCRAVDGAERYAAGEAFSYVYLGGKCSYKNCTCTDWDMLVLHHLDGRTKNDNVCRFFRGRHTKLLEELNKCVIFCGNHHLKTHALQKRAANETQYQKDKVVSLTTKHRGVKTPSRRQRSNSVECSR